ncbi:MAG: sulfurtransferase [Candidatus Altiarchaeales archaeon ex4484_2]|nr:MAG: sulfurtransferase [Candidatus Altiarchaeales archaeon ex4484_2]
MKKIENIMKSMTFEFFGSGKHKIKANDHFSKDNALFLDVRSTEEHDTLSFKLIHHMPVLHIPITEIPDKLKKIPKDKPIGIFCSGGVRSTIVYLYLRAHDYENVRILEGGYNAIVEEFKPEKLLRKIKNKGSSPLLGRNIS